MLFVKWSNSGRLPRTKPGPTLLLLFVGALLLCFCFVIVVEVPSSHPHVTKVILLDGSPLLYKFLPRRYVIHIIGIKFSQNY